jgi:hypothetical protein
MATSIASDKPVLAAADVEGPNDPFVTNNAAGPTHHRFSNFDHQLFPLGAGSSPEQAKRALEAHLAETERRMAEAGKLGTALVQQRKELTERLKEVEKLKNEGELGPDLRQKLAEIEKDYNDVARETARAFLPKQRVPSNETAAVTGSPFVPEGKGGRVSSFAAASASRILTRPCSDPSVPQSSRAKRPVPLLSLVCRIESSETSPRTEYTISSSLLRSARP